MRRREFIAAVGGAAVMPLAARAQGQQMTIATVGFLGPESPDLFADRLPAFQQALREAGFVEGRTVSIIYRWAEGQNSRLPALAADLIANQVAVIVAPGSTPAVFAAKSLTTTIPIVFFVGSDPVALGLVASLNRPGGKRYAAAESQALDDLVESKRFGLVIAGPFDQLAHLVDHSA